MGILLLQLFYNFSIGSLVAFDSNLYRIEKIKLVTIFSRKKTFIKNKFALIVTMSNKYGGVEIVNAKLLRNPETVNINCYNNQ